MQWFRNIFRQKVKLAEFPTGRLSKEPVPLFRSLDVRYRFVDPRYPKEWLKLIEKAVILNPDLAQMHELVIDLANTGHYIEIVPENQKLKNVIDEIAERINADSFVNELLSQIAIYGAVSLEIVVDENLRGIKKIVLVPPTTIFFAYNEELDIYEPYQYLNGDPIKLNPETYIYLPILTLSGSPYGIPPFLSALSAVEVQEDFRMQLKGLAQKLGLLGFLDLEIPLPQKAHSETEVEYQKRLSGTLENLANQVTENMQKGVLLHYVGTKAEFKEVGSNVAGVRDIVELNEQWVISGAKGQPSLLGRTSGSTETWATVAYEQFIRMLENYRRIVRRVMEKIYKMHCTLLGFEYDDINFVFNPIKSLNPAEDMDVYKKKVEAIGVLVQAGIMSIEEARKELDLHGGGK